jgi:hypothetical protein
MSTLQNRLSGHFAACGALVAAGAVCGIAPQTEASVIYSGVVNLPVANNVNGIYLNLATGAHNDAAGSTGSSAAPGWDINIYFAIDFYASGNPGYTYVGSGGTVSALTLGAPINAATSTGTGFATGPGFTAGVTGLYYGFTFQNETMGNAIQYGWAQYEQGVGGGPGVLIDYAYDNTGAGVNAGVVPTPGSLALLSLGAVGFAARRRK